MLDSLTTPTRRGAFAAFLVAEVHPFDDATKAQVRGRGVVAALGLLTVVLALARLVMR